MKEERKNTNFPLLEETKKLQDRTNLFQEEFSNLAQSLDKRLKELESVKNLNLNSDNGDKITKPASESPKKITPLLYEPPKEYQAKVNSPKKLEFLKWFESKITTAKGVKTKVLAGQGYDPNTNQIGVIIPWRQLSILKEAHFIKTINDYKKINTLKKMCLKSNKSIYMDKVKKQLKVFKEVLI